MSYSGHGTTPPGVTDAATLTRCEEMRHNRRVIIAGLWRWHSERCKCRSSDGACCELARTISGLDISFRKLEAEVFGD